MKVIRKVTMLGDAREGGRVVQGTVERWHPMHFNGKRPCMAAESAQRN